MSVDKEMSESFNRILWHDSRLKGLRTLRRQDVDDIILDVELMGISERELTRATIILEDVAFFICDIDLQGKRECSDDISSATCSLESDLKTRIQNERLKHSPGALKDYFHFSFYLIPPGGTVDILAAGFRLVVPGDSADALPSKPDYI